MYMLTVRVPVGTTNVTRHSPVAVGSAPRGAAAAARQTARTRAVVRIMRGPSILLPIGHWLPAEHRGERGGSHEAGSGRQRDAVRRGESRADESSGAEVDAGPHPIAPSRR